MKFMAKYSESLEIYIYMVEPVVLRHLIGKDTGLQYPEDSSGVRKVFGELNHDWDIKVTKLRALPPKKSKTDDRENYYHERGKTHWHSITLSKNLGAVKVHMKSVRLDADAVKQIGLEPNPEAESKEKEYAMIQKLAGAKK